MEKTEAGLRGLRIREIDVKSQIRADCLELHSEVLKRTPIYFVFNLHLLLATAAPETTHINEIPQCEKIAQCSFHKGTHYLFFLFT